MQRPELSRAQDPPDLLRRFTPTPLKAVYRIGEIRLIVETNDFALLPTLRLEAECDEPQQSEYALEARARRRCRAHRWRLPYF